MIDVNKKYRTRDGREVRVFMTDGGDWSYPVVAAYKDKEGRWWPLHLTAEGRHSPSVKDHFLDLIEVKPRIYKEYWVNYYSDGTFHCHPSRAGADRAADHLERKACVKQVIDCEEGEGL